MMHSCVHSKRQLNQIDRAITTALVNKSNMTGTAITIGFGANIINVLTNCQSNQAESFIYRKYFSVYQLHDKR